MAGSDSIKQQAKALKREMQRKAAEARAKLDESGSAVHIHVQDRQNIVVAQNVGRNGGVTGASATQTSPINQTGASSSDQPDPMEIAFFTSSDHEEETGAQPA